jgi:hypothetical protein
MDRDEARIADIGAQRTTVAPILHSYAKGRRTRVKAPVDEVAAFLTGVLHLCDQNGASFNEALAKARIEYLAEKRPIY